VVSNHVAYGQVFNTNHIIVVHVEP
jgi:hypothetical protein